VNFEYTSRKELIPVMNDVERKAFLKEFRQSKEIELRLAETATNKRSHATPKRRSRRVH